MNLPAIAKRTFEELKNQSEYSSIVNELLNKLLKIFSPADRARLIHETIDDFNTEIFAHPLVEQFSPCKMGCDACCHTQVSVTDDEAELLLERIHSGIAISQDRLLKQMEAKNDSNAFYSLSYADRRCIFLNDQGGCRVYEDRPSVCRTNAVIGEPSQCDTSQGIKPTRLIRTPKSDMAIYAAFLSSTHSGALPFMIGSKLNL